MILVLISALAHGAEDPLGPIALAEGGTRLARAQDLVCVVSNPGLLGLESHYRIGGFGQFGAQDRRGWGFTALDSSTSEHYALGLAYSGETYEPSLSDADLPGWTPQGKTPANTKRFHDVTVSVGVPIAGRAFSAGAQVDWAMFDHDQQGRGSVADIGLGMAGRPLSWLTLGATASNLLEGDPLGTRPFRVGAGAQALWTYGGVSLDTSWSVPQDQPGIAMGVQLGNDEWRVHGGWSTDDLAHSSPTASAGLSYQAPTLALAYGLAAPLADQSPDAWTHMLGIRIPMSTPSADSPTRGF